MRLIGVMWKRGNMWSMHILIGRGLDLLNDLAQLMMSDDDGLQGNARVKRLLCSGQGANGQDEFNTGFITATLDNAIPFPVTMARGSHLFPFRTQKLSLSAPMVLSG